MSHDHGTSASMPSSSAMAAGEMDMSEPFCDGDGTVMLPGFQSASEASVRCVLFLFEGAAVDSETKYAFAIIGVFLMGFANEMIRHGRHRLVKGSDASIGSDLTRTAAFAVQMLLAYFLMLLVMLYEYVFLIAIILGLSVGHLVTLRLTASHRQAVLESGGKTPPEAVGSSGSPCCNNDTCA